jgi:hypothetical protein
MLDFQHACTLKFVAVADLHTLYLSECVSVRAFAHAFVCRRRVDGNIKNEVFKAIEYSSTFIAFGSKHYGEDTGNSASTCKESLYVEGSACAGKKIVRIRMIPFGQQFAHVQGRTFFGMNDLELPWMLGDKMPDELVSKILEVMQK